MKIFYNDTALEITVNDNSYRYRAIKGEHKLTLYFSLPQHVELPVGAYCVFEGETYRLEAPENFKMQNTRNFEYTVLFESSQGVTTKYKFRNPIDKRLKFTLTATPREHLQMFVDNMNQRDSGWTIGQCIEAPRKPISYSLASCMDALSQQAEAFETEYEFNGKQVSLWKVEYNKTAPLPLSYGRGKGFKPGVGRTNFTGSKPVGVLYVQGGERNIDASKYKNKELLLPKGQSLSYDGKYFEGQAGFDASLKRTYVSDEDGVSIKRQDKQLQSFEESCLDLSHIYPSRVGEVTGVEVTKDGFCDFFDSTIPDALDFSTPESRFKGEKMTVVFQSGMLAGKEFEIHQNEARVIGYIHAERRFKVVEQVIDGEAMPKGVFMPKKGDKYAVFNIALPDAYLLDNVTKTGASWDMFREAVKYLYENEDPKFTFTGELDGIWAKKDWVNIGGRLKLGGYVLFHDDQFQPEGVGIRIVGIKEYINNPYSPEIELSNAVVGSSIMSDIRKIDSNEVLTNAQHKTAIQFTKRQFNDAQQTIAMLKAAFDNFGSSIQPITVHTMQLLAGDESLQFQFVAGSGTTADRAFSIAFNQQTKQLHVAGGLQSGFVRLQHKTLGITTIAPSHKESEYRSWTLEPFTSARLGDAEQSYYLYAKCRKEGQTSSTDYDSFVLSETPQAFDSDATYYYMLVGVLNSEIGGERSFAALYGYSEILPGRLTTDRIVSSDGKTYFDLLNGVINGAITFTSGSSGLENFNEWSAVEQKMNDTQSAAAAAERKAQEAKDYINNVLPSEVAEINRRLDGVVENWYSPYVPSAANAPASAWTTDALREAHVGDTFTNTQPFVDNATTPDAGKSWRWVAEGGYHWTPIADSDAVKALLKAAQAQRVAEGKNRTFVATPYTPYVVGDLWVQGDNGDLMRCVKARETGAFDLSDWDKASKYTDDNTVNSLMQRLADDRVISKEEKATLRNRFAQIERQYTAYAADAQTHGVSISALAAAKEALASFLTGTVAVAAHTDTSLTEAQRTEYNTLFSDYDVAVSRFTQLVADKVAQGKVDGVQVGGVNLARATKGVCQFSATESYFVKYFDLTVQPKIGEEYTLSWDDLVIPNDDDNYGVNVYLWSPSTSWEGVLGFANNFRGGAGSFTITIPSHITASDYRIAIYRSRVGGGRVTNLRLVRGNKPMMSWSPAPEDVQAEIDNIQVGGVNLLPQSEEIILGYRTGVGAQLGKVKFEKGKNYTFNFESCDLNNLILQNIIQGGITIEGTPTWSSSTRVVTNKIIDLGKATSFTIYANGYKVNMSCFDAEGKLLQFDIENITGVWTEVTGNGAGRTFTLPNNSSTKGIRVQFTINDAQPLTPEQFALCNPYIVLHNVNEIVGNTYNLPNVIIWERANWNKSTSFNLQQNHTFIFDLDSGSYDVDIYNDNYPINGTIRRLKLEQGNKSTDWSPAPEDVQAKINYGKIYLRGTGTNRPAICDVLVNEVSVLPGYGRGLILIVLRRINLAVVDAQVYDVYASDEPQLALASKLAEYGDDMLVALVSFDAISISTPELKAQITRCGGTQVHFVQTRMPYALLGIPGIGEGNGLEVYTSEAINAPYAEISTQVLSGTPQGITSPAARNAIAAAAQLADIASDNKLTPSEKVETQSRWEEIHAEFNSYMVQAQQLNLDSTPYLVSKDALGGYLTPLLANRSTTSDIDYYAFTAAFRAYYTARTVLIQAINEAASSGKRQCLIDATPLDQNKYYPLVIRLTPTERARIRVYAPFGTSTPSWSRHPDHSFSCSCVWTSVGSGWGAMPVTRYVEESVYGWTKDNVPPIGSIGQLHESSWEYIYVRGGGKYYVDATHILDCTLFSADWAQGDLALPLLDSVDVPVVDIDHLQQGLSDVDYLKKAFASGSTEVVGGVVLSEFIGIKDGDKVVAGMTRGEVTSNGVTSPVPLIFAGANGVLSASQTALYSLDRNGVQRSRDLNGNTITIYNGGISFETMTDGVLNKTLSMAPRIFAPTSSNPITAFADPELIGANAGSFNVRIPQADVDLEGYRNIPLIVHTGGLVPFAQTTLWNKTFPLGATFTVGGDATVKVPAMTFAAAVDIGFSNVMVADIDMPMHHAHIFLHNEEVGTDIYVDASTGNGWSVTTRDIISTGVPNGRYTLMCRSEGEAVLPYVQFPTMAHCTASVRIAETSFPVSWSSTKAVSKLFGNGFAFASRTNQYCGIIGSDTEYIFEHRSGDVGFRADAQGSKVWCPTRNEWIPADRVLYKGLVTNDGRMKRSWAYKGDKPDASKYATGIYKVNIQNSTLKAREDYLVRCTGIGTSGAADNRYASPYYVSNGIFHVTTVNGNTIMDGDFFFEVVDISDMQ